MPNKTNIIIPEYNLVIMPLRKCGHQSITKACQSMPGHGDTVNTLIRDNACVKEWKDKGAMVAAFVRNPFDRFVSFYEHQINGPTPNPALWPLGFEHHMPFEDAARLVASIPDEDADPHFRGQVHSLSLDGEFLPNWVNAFCRLSSAWKSLCRETSAPLPWLPHLNKSTRRSWISYYNANSLKLIGNRYTEDFTITIPF